MVGSRRFGKFLDFETTPMYLQITLSHNDYLVLKFEMDMVAKFPRLQSKQVVHR